VAGCEPASGNGRFKCTGPRTCRRVSSTATAAAAAAAGLQASRQQQQQQQHGVPALPRLQDLADDLQQAFHQQAAADTTAAAAEPGQPSKRHCRRSERVHTTASAARTQSLS